jgi:hypothetical protein
MDKFYENLKRFQPYEVQASELIKKYKNVEIFKFCESNKYDFKTSDGIKYEVKTEPSSIKTGNYFIEFWAYGKPSGISVTKAHYYIFSDTINYYLISIDDLKALVKTHGILKNTNDKLTCGHLVKCSVINDVSIKLN